MKKLFACVLLVMLILSCAACGSGSNNAGSSASSVGSTASSADANNAAPSVQKLNIKISCSGSNTGIDTKTAERFAESIKEKSGGAITASVYPQAQLTNGDQSKVPETLAAGGSFEMAFAAGANLTTIDERFQTHQLPFVYTSYDEVVEVMDGAGGKAYADILATKGITWMGVLHNGLRHITNSARPITKPEDLKGLKMRLAGGDVGMATFQSFGADPVYISFSELYTALQMGTADGQENGYNTAGAANLYEVQKYATECSWQYDGWFAIYNSNDWNSYDDGTRAMLTECLNESIGWARENMVASDEEYKQKFIDAGVEIYVLNEQELQVFKDAVADVKAGFVQKFGEDICKAFKVID